MILRPSRLEDVAFLPGLTDAQCLAVSKELGKKFPKMTSSNAVSCAQTLMGCYRKTDFQDPRIFATSMSALFAEYALEIARIVIDPVKGIPGKIMFPPSVAEVKKALDEEIDRRQVASYRAKWLLDERRKVASAVVKLTPEQVERRRAQVAALIPHTLRRMEGSAYQPPAAPDPASDLDADGYPKAFNELWRAMPVDAFESKKQAFEQWKCLSPAAQRR